LVNDFKGEIIVSAPMGAGMNYQDLRDDGKVIIVCGGTGILPFCDLIDLLFKRVNYLKNSGLVS
jgi:NAD(P)H-flavin reductase